MRKTFASSLIALLLLPTMVMAQPTGSSSSSPGSTVDQCQNKINLELSKELRRYRFILFGKPKAKDSPVGDIRYDDDGLAWIKTTDSSGPWKNGSNDILFSDEDMDSNDELRDMFIAVENSQETRGRRGIFETKRVLTSALIPYLLQNMRALSCNTDRICEQVLRSERQEGKDAVNIDTIQPAGCIEFKDLKTYPQCHLASKDAGLEEQSQVKGYCQNIRIQLLQREMALLRLAVEYDAGYRTTLQFAGVFDIFLEEVRWPLMGSIRQAASLIGQLNRIPCFLASCDESPPPEQN